MRLPSLIFVLVLAASVFVHQPPKNSPTPLSRLYLLHAVVERSEMTIDDHGSTPDVAFARGHYWSDKAPGTAALAFPAFWVASLFVDSTTDRGWLVTSWAACAFSQALPAAIGAACLFCWLRVLCGGFPAMVAVLGLFLGTVVLPYSTALFSHTGVFGLIAIGIWAMDLFRNEAPKARWRYALAGFCWALAVASEYTAGLVIVALLVWCWLHRRAGVAPIILGGILPSLLVPWYNWIVTGSLWTLPYSMQASFPEMKKGLYAIQWPDIETFGKLLISPERGLLVYCPVLVLAGVGFHLIQRRDWLWLCLGIPFLQTLIISGRTWDWLAGPIIGPRYLVPMFPLLAIPLAYCVQKFPRWSVGVTLASILFVGWYTAGSIIPKMDDTNPVVNTCWQAWVDGKMAHNLFGGGRVGACVFLAFLIAGCVALILASKRRENA